MYVPRRGRKVLRRRPVRARKLAKKHPSKGVTLGVKKYVKRVIARNIENKTVEINYGQSFGSYLEDNTLNCYPMLPYTGYMALGQGVTQGTRIGNQIKVRKVMLNYVLRPSPYDAVFNTNPQPFEMDLMLGYVKQYPGVLPNSADTARLFQSGATSFAPSGSLRDIISTLNTDVWHIAKRWRHKIGTANYGGTGANAGQQYFNNNDFKLNVVQKMDITKFCNKNLRFNDGGTAIEGKNLFFMYQALAASGGTFTATQLPANIEFWISLDYEDA